LVNFPDLSWDHNLAYTSALADTVAVTDHVWTAIVSVEP
jgi:hypothetical protein